MTKKKQQQAIRNNIIRYLVGVHVFPRSHVARAFKLSDAAVFLILKKGNFSFGEGGRHRLTTRRPSDQRRKILIQYLCSQKVFTLDFLGDAFGLSRQRIYQLSK